MIRRLFWLLVGAVLGVWALRRIDRATEAARPGNLARATGRRVGGTQARWTGAVTAGRDAARQREADLRGHYDVPRLTELGTDDRDTD